jgi:hypothetical protein
MSCCSTQGHPEGLPHRIAESEGVIVKIFKQADRAVLCLSTRAPVHLSGEYGIHAWWGPPGSARSKPPAADAVFYTELESFPTPLQLELPLPQNKPALHVDVGACVVNDYCNSVEFTFNVKTMRPSPTDRPIACAP